MAVEEVIRLVKVRSGRVHEVRFTKCTEMLYLASAHGVRTIRIHASKQGWTAHCGGGISYHSKSEAKVFALAANNFWK